MRRCLVSAQLEAPLLRGLIINYWNRNYLLISSSIICIIEI